MNPILKIIDFLQDAKMTPESLINLLGKEEKKIGRHHFLSPNDKYFRNISISENNRFIDSIGITLTSKIDLFEFEKLLKTKTIPSYSLYDNLTHCAFKIKENIQLILIFEGTIDLSLSSLKTDSLKIIIYR